MKNYIDPEELLNESKILNDEFFLYLSKIVNVFPEAKLNPLTVNNNGNTNNELYNDSMNNLLNTQTSYFMIDNDITKLSNELLNHGKDLDNQTKDINIIIKKLSNRLDSLKSSSNSAKGLFDDTILTRNQLYTSNIILFLCIITSVSIGYKLVISDKNK